MKNLKFTAPALTALGLILGATALADDPTMPPPDAPPPMAQLQAFYVCDPLPHLAGEPMQVCIESGPETAGMICTISDDSGVLISIVLQPGDNYVVVSTSSASVTASGPWIDGKVISTTFPDNPGLN